jgi:hypothetical protein
MFRLPVRSGCANGARGLRGALMRRMNSERYRRGTAVCRLRSTGGGLQRSGLSVHTTAAVPSAAAASARTSSRHSISRPRPRPRPRARYCRACRYCRNCRRISTGGDRWRRPHPKVARTFLSARAGRNACPTLPCPPFRAFAAALQLPTHPTPIDPRQPPSSPVNCTFPCPLSPATAYCHCLLLLPVSCHCLLPLPTATSCLAPWRFKTPSCFPAFLIQNQSQPPHCE